MFSLQIEFTIVKSQPKTTNEEFLTSVNFTLGFEPLNKCNGLVETNKTTNAPKSVLRYFLDKDHRSQPQDKPELFWYARKLDSLVF